MDAPHNKLFSSFGNLQVTLVAGVDMLDGWPVAEFSNTMFIKCGILNDSDETIVSFSTSNEAYSGGEIDLYHQMYMFDNVRSTFKLEVTIFSFRVWPLATSSRLPPYTEVKLGELVVPLSRLGVGISVSSWHQLSSDVKECSKASIKLDLRYVQEGLVVHDISRTMFKSPVQKLQPACAREAGSPTASLTSSSASPDERDPKAASPTPRPESSSIRILVVDDSPTCQRLLIKLLQAKGFIIDIANNGQEAFDKLNEHNPCIYDAVTMDLRMPVMDGLTATKLIRLQPHLKRVPILATSADLGLGIREETIMAGASCFIAKPVRAEDIEAELAKHIMRKDTDVGDGVMKLSKDDFFSSRDDRDAAANLLKKSQRTNSPGAHRGSPGAPKFDFSDMFMSQPIREVDEDAEESDDDSTSREEDSGDLKSMLLPVGIADYCLIIGPAHIPGDTVEDFRNFDDHTDINVKIWDRYPRQDHHAGGLPDSIECFACPNRSRFVTLPCDGRKGVDGGRPDLEFSSFVMSGKQTLSLTMRKTKTSKSTDLTTAGDEEQYATCIKFFLLVHISEIEASQTGLKCNSESNSSSNSNNSSSADVSPTHREGNKWWLDEEPDSGSEVLSSRKLHYAEITVCLLTRGGPFLPQLSQVLHDMYTHELLPMMMAWEEEAFSGLAGERKAMQFNCLAKLSCLCWTCPAPLPGMLHVALTLESEDMNLSCHVGSSHITCPSRLVLPGQSKENEVVFSLPPPTSLPISSHPLEVLFQYMGPRGVIDLLSCALCEKKILLHSFDTAKLVVIGEGLRALLYPLKWTHVYVPIVPVDLLNLVEAPVPFILGVDSKLLLEDERNGGLSEEFLRYHDVVLADCDSGVVLQAGGWGVSLVAGKYLSSPKAGMHINVVEKEMTNLPPLVDRWLVSATKTILRENKYRSGSFGPWGCTSTALQIVIFDALAVLLHRIDDCLFFLDAKTPVFNRPLFLSEFSLKENRPFLAAVTDTNSFHLLTASMSSTSAPSFFKNVIKSLSISEENVDNGNAAVGSTAESSSSSSQPWRGFVSYYPEWVRCPKSHGAEDVETFIKEALRSRLERYCHTLSCRTTHESSSDVDEYSGDYLLLQGIEELPILKKELMCDRNIATMHQQVVHTQTDNSHNPNVLITFPDAPEHVEVSLMTVNDLAVSEDTGSTKINPSFICRSIQDLHPNETNRNIYAPRFKGGNVQEKQEIGFPLSRIPSSIGGLSSDFVDHPDRGLVNDPLLLVENIVRSQEAHEEMIDTIGRFLQYVFSSPRLEERVLNELISSLNAEMKFLSSRRRFLDMLSRAHPSSADKRLFPLRSIAFEALVQVFISFLNDCQLLKDFLSAQKLIGFAETFVRVETDYKAGGSADSDDCTDGGDLHADTMHGTLNALVEGNAPIESICDKIKHHRIFHNLELWKVVLHSVEVMYKSGHTAKYNSMAGNAVTVKLCRSVLVMMLSLEVNLDRAMAFIQLVSSDWKLEMNSYFDLQRFTSDLWKDTGDCEKMLHLYKKFGLNLMARLTDVVLDLGTTMEVIPASEEKSKILRILDLENFNAPEDLENIIPRSSSVLEVSITDVIYHINNKSLSTDMEDASSFGMMPTGRSGGDRASPLQFGSARSPPGVSSFASEIESREMPFRDDFRLPIASKVESQRSIDMQEMFDVADSGSGSDDFEFSDDGKEALLDNDHHAHLPPARVVEEDDGLPSISSMLGFRAADRTFSLKVHTGQSWDVSDASAGPLSTPSASDKTTNDSFLEGYSPFEEAFSADRVDDGAAVASLTCVGKLAVCGLADGNMNIIDMETGQSVTFPCVKNPSSSDICSRMAPIPPPLHQNSVYAGVSFSGDVYKTSAAYAGIQYCGQGFVSSSRDGSLHAWALPTDPFREASDPTPGLDIFRAASSSDKIAIGRTFSTSSTSAESALKDGSHAEAWRVGSSSGSSCPSRALLVTLSATSGDYSIPTPHESPHLFSTDSAWQIATGDSKGHITIHRGHGILAAPIVAKRRSSISLSSAQGFSSDTVRTMMTQMVGVGGVGTLCSLGRQNAPRSPNSGLESVATLSDRLAIGTTGGYVIAIDVNTGSAVYRVEGHKPSGVSCLSSMRDNEFVSCGNDRSVRLWDIRTNNSVATLTLSRAPVTCLSVSEPDDNIIFIGTAGGEVKMWDLRFDRVDPSMVLVGHTDRLTGLILRGDGALLTTSSLDGTVRVWDVASGKCAQIISAFASYGVESISASQSSSAPGAPLRQNMPRGGSKAKIASWLTARSTTGKLRIWRSEI